jgi:hypothetical protein
VKRPLSRGIGILVLGAVTLVALAAVPSSAEALATRGARQLVAVDATQYPFGQLSVGSHGTLYYVDRQSDQIDDITKSGSHVVITMYVPVSGLSVTNDAIWFAANGILYTSSLDGRNLHPVGKVPGAVDLDVLPDGTIYYSTASAIYERSPSGVTTHVAGGTTVDFAEQFGKPQPAIDEMINPTGVVGVNSDAFYFTNENDLYFVEHGKSTILRPLLDFFNGELARTPSGTLYGICHWYICRIEGKTFRQLFHFPEPIDGSFAEPDAFAVSPSGSFYISYADQSSPTRPGIAEISSNGKVTAVLAQQTTAANEIASSVAARLLSFALGFARANGDAHPSSIEAVATTRGAALTVATPGDFVTQGDSATPVYLVVMQGNFTDYGSSPPAGAALPTGNYLSAVIDQTTFEVLDYGLSEKPPPVSPSTLGPVTTLRSPRLKQKPSAVVFKDPHELAVSPSGNLYVRDDGLDKIFKRLPNGTFTVVAGNGQHGFSGDGGSAVDAELDYIGDMTFASNGTLYFADGNRIRAVSPKGRITTVAGNGSLSPINGVANGTSALLASLGSVSGLTFGPGGDLYFAGGNNQVLKLIPSGRIDVVAPSKDFAHLCGIFQLYPTELAFNGAGDLYVSTDNGFWLTEITTTGRVLCVSGLRRAGGSPGALASGPKGTVWGDWQNEIVRIEGSKVKTFLMFSQGTVPKVSGTFAPDDIAVARNGTIYADAETGGGWTNTTALIAISPNRNVTTLWAKTP